jgi:hypothetical protein
VCDDDLSHRLLQSEGPICPEKEPGKEQHPKDGSPEEDEKEIAEAFQRLRCGGRFPAEFPHHEQNPPIKEDQQKNQPDEKSGGSCEDENNNLLCFSL